MTLRYILEAAKRVAKLPAVVGEIENIGFAVEYAEPGYSQPEKGILFADWNDKRGWVEGKGYGDPNVPVDNTMGRLERILSSYGYECEWSDEWLVCDCGKAFRTQADCYAWTMHGWIGDGDYQCGDCVRDDPADYLADMEDNPDRAVTIGRLNLAKHGYTRAETDYETGWYPGQNDNPREVYAQLKTENNHVIFKLDSVGQFDGRWSAWTREDTD